jgi:type I restriction enzyme S subunit
MRDGWVKTKLGLVSEFIMGQAPLGERCNKDGIGTPFVKAGEFEENRPKIVEWTTDPLKIAKSSDVLVCVVGATAGKINLGADCAIGRSVAAVRPGEKLHQLYLYYLLSLELSNLRSGSRGSAQGVITKDDLHRIVVALPPILEQKRIVDLISSVDSYIEALQQQLESAKRSRSAVLHELLTAGGADWVESSLGSVAQWSGGITPSMANSEFWTEGDIPWISSGDIATYESQGTKKNVTRRALSDSSLKLLPIGTVILVVRSGILIHSLPMAILRVPACINQDIKAAQVNENVKPEFLWIYLRFMEKEILARCRKTGTTVQSISTEALLSMKINIPPLTTQNNIIRMILMFDDIVNKTVTTIDEAKTMRSGLLSDLLSGTHEIPASYDKVMGSA